MKFPDLWLLIPALTLTSIGLLITSTVSPNEFSFQWKVAILAIICAFLIAQIDSELIYLFSKLFYIISLLLLVLLFLVNDSIRGSRRWITIGPIVIQVSEFAKISLIVMFAGLAKNINVKAATGFIFSIIIIFIPTLLVFLEPDLGSSIIIGIIGFLSLLALRPKKRHILLILLLIIIAIPIIVSLLAPYQKARIDHFINPSKDPLGASYNQIQAIIAVGSGQVIGMGLGKGSQSRLHFLPEKQTDFFFATAAEQLGFVGSALIILFYNILGWRILTLSNRIEYKPAKVLLIGSLGLLFFQPIIHIGINLGILPVTGITLPFLSVGGSSLLVSWVCVGIVMSIENDNRELQAYEIA